MNLMVTVQIKPQIIITCLDEDSDPVSILYNPTDGSATDIDMVIVTDPSCAEVAA
jgi:hypothetical protein